MLSLRFQVGDSALPALFLAARYQKQARREVGYVRCELLQDPNQHQTLVLWQVFRDSTRELQPVRHAAAGGGS